jgi:hypothetical protein
MKYNYNFVHVTPNIAKFIKKLNFYNFELMNFIIIIIHQALLLSYFYQDFTLEESTENISLDKKYSIYDGTLGLCIIQLVYLFFVLVLWFILKYPLHYNKHLMSEYYTNDKLNKGKLSKKKFAPTLNEKGDPIYIDEISWRTKFNIGLFRAILTNREVIVYILTIICIALYLGLKCAVFLSIPVLFVANLSDILFGIILSIKLRIFQMFTVLMFTYLLIYVYTWISFYFIPESMVQEVFDPDHELVPNSEDVVMDYVCTTGIQCLLILISAGVRSGGGIADVLNKVNFKSGAGYYMIRFFYNITFHIIIVAILGIYY